MPPGWRRALGLPLREVTFRAESAWRGRAVETPAGPAPAEGATSAVGWLAVSRPVDAQPGATPEPPADPEAWTDEQWLAWLRATDGAGFGGSDDEDDLAPGTRMHRLHDAARGEGAGRGDARPSQRHVRHPERRGRRGGRGGRRPTERRPFHDVRLDPDHPERSEVVVRPHRHQDGAADEDGTGADEATRRGTGAADEDHPGAGV